jgi:hypothetical protein
MQAENKLAGFGAGLVPHITRRILRQRAGSGKPMRLASFPLIVK